MERVGKEIVILPPNAVVWLLKQGNIGVQHSHNDVSRQGTMTAALTLRHTMKKDS